MAVDGDVVQIGSLQKRASRIISNSALYDLVEDMAAKLDALDPRLHKIDTKLDTILEKLNG
jgi:hypothetical protein